MSQVGRRMKRALSRKLALLVLLVGAMAALVAGGAGTPASMVPAARLGGSGYWLAGSGGGVYAFGAASDFGGLSSPPAPVATIAPTSSGKGYWLATTTGEVFAFGDAVAHGGLGGIKLNKPIVGMAPTPDGDGYWLVASDGGMFAFGDAGFFGSMGGKPLNKPIVGMTPTATGRGYWCVASDGGLFAFGDAGFFGSMGDKVLNKPMTGMAASRTGRGYRMVAADGGVFSFGDALFYGSTGDKVLNQPIQSMAATPSGNGYWFVANDGGVFSFGDAVFSGAAVGRGQTIVGMATVNALPKAVNDAATTDEDIAAVIDPMANDKNLTDGPLTLTVESGPSMGTASVEAGRLVYRPTADANGADALSYRVTDGDGDSAVGRISLTVRPVDDAPEISSFGAAGGGGGTATIDEDTQGTVGFSIADRDSALGALAVTASSSNTTLLPGANITFSGSGAQRTMTFRPAADQNGTAVVTVSLSDGHSVTKAAFTVAVTPVNDAPVATDANVTTNEDQVVSGYLNTSPYFAITDVDDSAFFCAIKASRAPVHGTASMVPNCFFSYGPDAQWNGPDQFTVIVSDAGGLSDEMTVFVTVNNVNDTPVVTGSTLTAIEDGGAVTGSVSATDEEGDLVTFSLGSEASKGVATVDGDGTVHYTPDANRDGIDTFTVSASDGNTAGTATVTVEIAPENDAPVTADRSIMTDEDTAGSVTITASDVDGSDVLSFVIGSPATPTLGTASVDAMTGIATYTPAANQNGGDSFTVVVSDGHGGTATSAVTVTVNPVNDAPVAPDAAASTAEDTPVSGTATATDVESDPVAFSLAIAPDAAHGTAGVAANGAWTYTPAQDWNGTDTFTVKADDGHGGIDTALVTVTVTAVNDAPVTAARSITTNEDTAGSVTIPGSDVDGDTLSFSVGTAPAKGSVTFGTGGALTYTPSPDQNGGDSFTVVVSDGHGGSAISAVAVTVNPVNDAPVATPDTYEVGLLGTWTFDPLANDTDVDDTNPSLTLTMGTPTGGAIVCTGRSCTYNRLLSTGTVTISYAVSDTHGASSAGTVTITEPS